MMISGIGQQNFVMKEGKEYVLVFVAFKEGMQIPSFLTEPSYVYIKPKLAKATSAFLIG